MAEHGSGAGCGVARARGRWKPPSRRTGPRGRRRRWRGGQQLQHRLSAIDAASVVVRQREIGVTDGLTAAAAHFFEARANDLAQ